MNELKIATLTQMKMFGTLTQATCFIFPFTTSAVVLREIERGPPKSGFNACRYTFSSSQFRISCLNLLLVMTFLCLLVCIYMSERVQAGTHSDIIWDGLDSVSPRTPTTPVFLRVFFWATPKSWYRTSIRLRPLPFTYFPMYCHVQSDYKWGLDWTLDLFTT
jgi:hypothetical protein